MLFRDKALGSSSHLPFAEGCYSGSLWNQIENIWCLAEASLDGLWFDYRKSYKNRRSPCCVFTQLRERTYLLCAADPYIKLLTRRNVCCRSVHVKASSSLIVIWWFDYHQTTGGVRRRLRRFLCLDRSKGRRSVIVSCRKKNTHQNWERWFAGRGPKEFQSKNYTRTALEWWTTTDLQLVLP